jgi:glycosyltransferase involved in cell wall biosynthesis
MPAAREVAGWGAKALFVPDDVPPGGLACRLTPATSQRVVVAGSLDDTEPVQATIEAARLLPQCEVILTGDFSRLPRLVIESAPDNVVFSGWLSYPRFLAELNSANVVAAFSLDPGVMNRAAFEAIGLGKALVLSDIPGLRECFGNAAVYCANQSGAMAAALRVALADRQRLELSSRLIRDRLETDRQVALGYLARLVDAPVRVEPRA